MRNENGFGSIVCLDKSGKKRRKPWAVRITTGWKDGRQQRKYLGYYKTQADALMALAEYHKNGINLDLTKLTLNDVFERLMERVEKKELTESTIRGYKMAQKHFNNLGNMQFNQIKTPHLQQWMDDIDLKPGSKHKLKSTMIQIYKYAVANDIIQKNYADSIEITEKVEKTGSVFTEDEIATLWKHKDEKEVRQLLILIYTGMRIGELLAISRDNINFEEKYMIGGSKTEAGKNRIIPIHDKILPLVKEQLGDNLWLIRNNRGMVMSYRGAYDQFGKLFERFGMNHKAHDTRKTSISWMHSGGLPMETIRIIVGHSGKGVTEKVYLFKSPKELVEAINSVEIQY